MVDAFGRAGRGLRRYGLGGTLRRGGKRLREHVYLRTEHVWYELSLGRPRPRKDLPPGFDLRRADEGEIDLLAGLPTLSPAAARRRLDDSADLWLVSENATPAFACWIFHRRMPVLAAPGGSLEVPAGTVCLEDSVTAPAFRGRGIAPGAWSAIADMVAQVGASRMVTQVAVENAPSRKAVEKAGFAEVARVRFARTGRWTKVSVVGDGELAAFLRARLPVHASSVAES